MITTIPAGYRPRLDLKETGEAISRLREFFARELSRQLNLTRMAAPLFVPSATGLNDDLAQGERPVSFAVKEMGQGQVEIVHSLAKWKRMALEQYGFQPGEGLYTDMNAIRRDEELDNIHSIYVDQWDWEKVISSRHRSRKTLQETVQRIYKVCTASEDFLVDCYPGLNRLLPPELFFITTDELEKRYPDHTPPQREELITREKGAVFLLEIGKPLSDGKPHEKRAPDYDDWSLNGDLLFWYPLLERAVEISSMGIRVDPETLKQQLHSANCTERLKLPYHQRLLAGELPPTIGGGIGQSRLALFFLDKAHIGEVQASIWPDEVVNTCRRARIQLL